MAKRATSGFHSVCLGWTCKSTVRSSMGMPMSMRDTISVAVESPLDNST